MTSICLNGTDAIIGYSFFANYLIILSLFLCHVQCIICHELSILKLDWQVYLSVTLISGLICFAQIKSHYLGVVIAELLHDVQRPLTKCLTNGIKEHEDQICQVPCFGKKKNILKKFAHIIKHTCAKKKINLKINVPS